jgi:3',5'-cyclic AMP phosphodiesterase CpdA
MKLIQISDPHVVARVREAPGLVSGRLDTAAALERTVGRIVDLRARVGPVSALLVTGDVTDDGMAESYARFRAIGLPVLAIPGNHDRREPMRAAFADTGLMPESGALNWICDLPGLRVIGLDTLVEGESGGCLGPATLGFLADALEAAPDGPVLIALHHPPFPCGIGFMDAIGLSDAYDLVDILRSVRREVRLVCGHIHNIQFATVGGCSALSAPALCSTIDFDFRDDAPAGFLDSPGGFLLHDWGTGFRSLAIPATRGDGPYPFAPASD